MINHELHPKLKPSIIYSELGNKEVVILNFETKYLYTLNEVGTRIWQLLNGNNSINDIVGVIVNEYDIDREAALKSVTYQIEEFINEKMVEL